MCLSQTVKDYNLLQLVDTILKRLHVSPQIIVEFVLLVHCRYRGHHNSQFHLHTSVIGPAGWKNQCQQKFNKQPLTKPKEPRRKVLREEEEDSGFTAQGGKGRVGEKDGRSEDANEAGDPQRVKSDESNVSR